MNCWKTTSANWRRLNRVENVSRGDIFYANLNPVIGSEQGGVRPVLVLQNDIGNKYSPTTIVAAITSRIKKAKLPTHVELASEHFSLEKDSVILLEQVRTIDKRRLKEKIAHLDEETMNKIDEALQISLGLTKI
ncbi:MAG: type II toxin-antitoxin system PemK/MazF family toxin [Firmicutes bacterium]|nr:type II toxin-antitoxin system PemK/MazF family toxin [Bacillota bacterium]